MIEHNNMSSEQKTTSPNQSKLIGYILIVLFLIIATLLQILFKGIALSPSGKSYLALAFDPMLYVGGCLFGLQAVVWLAVLRRMPLSTAYPITSLTVITLLISAVVVYGETITTGNLIGSIVIMAGIAVIGSGKC